MTTPRKHHYVPQVHIKKFERAEGFFVYHKDGGKVVPKKTTNDIFVIKDLNSSLNEDGDIDHTSVEKALEEKWDSLFNSHFDTITSWLIESVENNSYSDIPINDSLKYFFEYALMGYQRAQKGDAEFNRSVLEPILDFEELIPDLDNLDMEDSNLTKEQHDVGVESIKNFIHLITGHVREWQDKLKFPAPIATGLEMLVPDELVCDFILSDEGPFHLPDTTAVILKSEEEFEYQNRKLNKIVSVGLPLCSMLYLQIKNVEFFPDEKTDIYSFKQERVNEVNKTLFSVSRKQILVDELFISQL